MKWPCLFGGMLICLSAALPAHAQGLVWSLPEDGDWVRYEGTYSQLVRRPNSPQGDLQLEWRRYLTIKSVGEEMAEYNGEMQPCRWLEFKTETGKTTEGVLDAGPGGIRMYKVLVPESAIRGTVNEPVGDGRELFVSYLPVVKGYRRLGDEPAQEMESGVFQIYPLVSLMRHYRNLAPEGDQLSVSVPAGDVQAQLYKGDLTMETTSRRSSNSCDLYRSDEIPFGVARWEATTTAETKGTIDLRSAFEEAVVLKESMQAVSTGTDAESDFLIE